MSILWWKTDGAHKQTSYIRSRFQVVLSLASLSGRYIRYDSFNPVSASTIELLMIIMMTNLKKEIAIKAIQQCSGSSQVRSVWEVEFGIHEKKSKIKLYIWHSTTNGKVLKVEWLVKFAEKENKTVIYHGGNDYCYYCLLIAFFLTAKILISYDDMPMWLQHHKNKISKKEKKN